MGGVRVLVVVCYYREQQGTSNLLQEQWTHIKDQCFSVTNKNQEITKCMQCFCHYFIIWNSAPTSDPKFSADNPQE